MGDGTDSRLKRVYTGIHEFLTEKWVATHEEAKASRLHRFAHYWLLVFKSFSRNHCPLRATALAYTTLLALIPLLAIGFGITSSVLREKDAAATKKIIGALTDEHGVPVESEKLLEIDFSGGKAVAAADQFGKGVKGR